METAARAPCPALPAPVTLLPRPAPQAQPDGSFVYREADALKFQEYYDGLGEECPLVPTRNSVKDKGKEALITVVPPIGITARPHAKQKARRPHDRKRLTLLGREALQRSSPTRTKGEAWKGTVVWKLEYQCRGTSLCDPASKPAHRGCRCDVRLVYSATVEQVDKELVRVEVTGVGGAGAISLHSRSMRWDPARLRAERGLREPARQAAVQEAERQALIYQLLPNARVTATGSDFACDYGINIYAETPVIMGDRVVILDAAPVFFGANVRVENSVVIASLTHPLEAAKRRAGWQQASPVKIGDNVVLCEGCTVLPGAVIPAGSVIEPGKVVTR